MLPTPCLAPKKHCSPFGWFRLFRKYFCYGQIKSNNQSQEAKPRSPPVYNNWFYVSFIHERPHWVTAVAPLCICILFFFKKQKKKKMYFVNNIIIQF